MTDKELFLSHLDRSRKTVEEWPSWKKEVLSRTPDTRESQEISKQQKDYRSKT